ncbi:MAG: hypothetical protein QM597_00335 [Aeromicrobium sp.]|uniref:hypothetical protein n=1 Tax=Aeromicrobium sp. TaxID=1871063 RepID=UPI0039E32103
MSDRTLAAVPGLSASRALPHRARPTVGPWCLLDLLGPLAGPLVMWWNFVARDHDEIVAAREAWMDRDAAAARFGRVEGYGDRFAAAPDLPERPRLRPRVPLTY